MNRVELLPYADVSVTVESRIPRIAVIGLVLSALGWLTCGVTAVLGVPISLISLFCRGSKGAGIAGVLVGLPTIAVLVFLLVMAWGIRTAAQVASAAAQNVTVVMANTAREKLEGEPAAVEVLGVIESIEWDLLRSGEESQKREKSIGAYRVKGSRNSGTVLIEVAKDDPQNTNPDIQWAVLVKDDGSEIPMIDNGAAVERDLLP
jgi:hypothetical protein